MKNELQKLLEDWGSEKSMYVEKRRFDISNNNAMPGEYKIALTMEGKVAISAAGKIILKCETIYTFAQNENNEDTNSLGDVYRIKRLMNKLESDFFLELDNEISAQLQEINPDGFFS